jgi:hypothetical protein
MTKDKNEFQHSIPRKAVLKNFVDKQGIWICDKIKGVNHNRETPIKKPKYDVNFGKANFYGHNKIKDLTSDEIISPKIEIRFEDFLSEFIEKPITDLFDRIIKTKSIKLTLEEQQLIKLYCYIQHVRTPKYKKDIDDFLNTNSYQEILDSIPANLKGIIESKLKDKFSSNNHTELCILSKSLNDFILETKINEKLIHLLVGNKDSHFILPDSGLIWALISDINEEVCYIPISSDVCIFLSKQPKGKLHLHSPETLKELTWIEADKEVYSDDKLTLEQLHNKMKTKKIITLKDGTKTFE